MNNILAPYNIINDNTIMLLFILNIVSMAYVFIMNGTSIIERLKYMFYYGSKQAPFNNRTHITGLSNAFLYAQTIFYLTIITIEFLKRDSLATYKNGATLHLIVFSLFYTVVLLFKYSSYYIVNSILFTRSIVKEWQYIYFFTIKLLGFALTPAIIAILFTPSISFNHIKLYLLFVLFAYLCMTIINMIKIIFIQKLNILDIFLYLCTLEFLPTLFVWKFILQLNDFTTIKI